MELYDVMRNRYSVRAYRPNDVEEDKLQRILEAARLAPTATNRQGFQLIIIHTENRKAELQSIYPQAWFVQAPLIICACGNPADNWVRRQDGKNYMDVDIAIVMDHLILAAASEGLGTCWIGAFDPANARKVLHLPPEVQPIAFTPLGYAADQPRPKRRKPLSELVRYEQW